VIPDCLSYIGNYISRQGIDVLPVQVVAFIGFVIDRFTAPGANVQEEIHAFIAFVAMHHARKGDVLLFDQHPHLLPCFARRRCSDGLVSIQMAGRDTIFAITIAGIEPAQQQYFVTPEEKKMNGNGKPGAHREIIQAYEKGVIGIKFVNKITLPAIRKNEGLRQISIL
jgi:hypothetical protein